MPNQVLAFHRVSDREFDLTQLRTGSVRDQLLRSTLVARALVAEGLVSDAPDAGLLVMGAGAAGMNLALSVAQPVTANANAHVIEIQPGPFTSLLKSTSRRSDPVEYDWPQKHYQAGLFPRAGHTIPFLQFSGTGADLAHAWIQAWNDWLLYKDGRGGRGKVELEKNRDARQFTVRPLVPGSAFIQVTGPFAGVPNTTRNFGAVVHCVGFSGEVTSDTHTVDRWDGYTGPTFWLDDDTLTPPVIPTPTRPLPTSLKRIVISGGGDGGMQDFQRATTALFGKELLERLEQKAVSNSLRINLQDPRLLFELTLAEDAGRRSYAWQLHGKLPVRDTLVWHQTYERAVAAFLSTVPAPQLRALALDVFRPELLAGVLDVTWIYRTQSPGYAYGLNRYLCLVLQHLLTALGPQAAKNRVLVDHEIVKMTPQHRTHQCISAAACIGHPHNLVLEDSAHNPTNIYGADLVIVRHGAVQGTNRGRAPVREQMTPYDFPQ